METITELLTQNSVPFLTEGNTVIIPSKGIAICVLELHAYSEMAGKKSKSNLEMFSNFQKRGLRLIQIFESEFKSSQRIIRTRIKSYLGLLPYKIFARKCEVREISHQLKCKFLNKYHIQGQDYGSGISLGLFYRNRLVSVASFGKRENSPYELTRFSGNSSFNVCGGASKILAFFERKFKPQSIISFADKRWSAGDVYFKLGFRATKVNPPSYWYFRQREKILHHKFGFRKERLKKKLEYYDGNFSEWENMKNNGWDRIWDCGIVKFEKTYGLRNNGGFHQ